MAEEAAAGLADVAQLAGNSAWSRFPRRNEIDHWLLGEYTANSFLN
jgi:hypothetical protein